MPKRKVEEIIDGAIDDNQEETLTKRPISGENVSDFQEIKHKRNPLPSASELRAINEAANLYKNNSFKAQLDSLIQSVTPKEKHISDFEKVIYDLHPYLTSLPAVDPIHPLDATDSLSVFRTKNKQHVETFPVAIPYPIPFPTRSTAWKVAFKAPVRLNVVGSWATKAAFKRPEKNWHIVDLSVEMPSELFQEKDYRNSRFFHKRAFYLGCIATAIFYYGFNFDISYESSEENPRLTNLLLTPRSDDLSKLNVAIRIIPVAADDIPIPVKRLLPSQANIRVSDGSEDQAADNFPSPIYNSTLGRLLGPSSRSILIKSHQLLEKTPCVRDALALLRIWGNQRGYGSGSYTTPSSASEFSIHRGKYCVRGFEDLGAWWICLLNVLIFGEEPSAYLTKKKARPPFGAGLSSYQLFRGVLDFLAKQDWEHEPVFMRVVETGSTVDFSEWTSIGGPVFTDPTGLVNMLASVPISSLQLLARDASTTLYALDKDVDPFDAVFMTDMREPQTRFDCIVRINLLRIQQKIPPMSADFPTTRHFLINLLLSTARQALGIRAKAIVILHSRSQPRPITSSLPSELTNITLGVIYDPVHAVRLVDHGPPVEAPESEQEAFRAFWGPKADLRRFKDGRILYSCVWDDNIIRVEDRESIPVKILSYIFRLKFGLNVGNDVVTLNTDHGSVIASPRRGSVKGRGDCLFTDAIKAYEKFSKELKTLEDSGDLVLSLVVTKPCSPALRYMSVLPPSPIIIPSSEDSSPTLHPSASYLPAFRVILQLERSSQWPDDLRTIQRVKMALLEGIARGFLKMDKKCRAKVVISREFDSNESSFVAEDGPALEVIVDGWAFHAYIWHDREATLLKEMTKMVKRPGFIPPPLHERSRAQKLLENYNRHFIHGPAHHSALLALHHKYSSLSTTIRLVKRWLGSHWANTRVRDEAIELICVGIYLSNACDVPATAGNGFMRAVDFLSRWDGVTYVKLFEEARNSDPGEPRIARAEGNKTENTQLMQVQAGQGSWRIATLDDPSGTVWCDTITPLVSARIRTLAKALIKAISSDAIFPFKSLFIHPTEDYDFLLHLNTDAVTRYWEGIHSLPSVWTTGYANFDLQYNQIDSIRIEFNPAEALLRDLQRIYADVIEFFYDTYGGTVIGGTWKPDLIAPRAWKVYLGYSSAPDLGNKNGHDNKSKSKDLVALNKEAIMSEIQRIGEGIIKSVSYNRD